MHLPSDNQDRVKFLVDLYRRVRDQLADWREQSRVYYNLYNSFVGQGYPLPFDVFYPIPFSAIETLMPRYLHGLMYRRPLVHVLPASPLTPRGAADAAHRLVNKWLLEPENWLDSVLGLKESLILGTAASKIAMTRRKRKIVTREAVESFGIRTAYKKVPRIVNITNRPSIISRDMFDVYPDIDRTKPSEMRFVFDCIVKGMDEIRNGEVEYDLGALNELEAMSDWSLDEVESTARLRENLGGIGYSVTHAFDQNTVPDEPRHLLECTFREFVVDPVTGYLIEEIHLITIGNEKVLLRDDIISYWPWVFYRNNPNRSEFMGRSELQPIESLAFAFNDLLNINMTNALGCMTKMLLASSESEIDIDNISVEAFGLVQGENVSPEHIRLEAWADQNTAGHRLMVELMQGITMGTGQSDYLRGANPGRKEFASSVLAFQQAAEARVDASIKRTELTAVAPTARAMIECAQDNLEEPDFVPNPESPTGFDAIDMYSIQGIFDYKVSAAAAGVKDAQRTQLKDFAQMLGQMFGPNTPSSILLAVLQQATDTYDDFEAIRDAVTQLSQEVQQPTQPGGPASGSSLGAAPGGAPNVPGGGLADIVSALAGASPAVGPGPPAGSMVASFPGMQPPG